MLSLLSEIRPPVLRAGLDFHAWLDGRIREKAEAGRRERAALRSFADVKRRKQKVRESLFAGIGYAGKKESFTAEIRGREDGGWFVLEKILLEKANGVRITANAYLPKDKPAEKMPAVLFLCGHYTDAKAEPQYQEAARRIAAAGNVVLIVDPVGQGERASFCDARGGFFISPGVDEHLYVGAQCAATGKTLAAYFLEDAVCALDYLLSRADVDPDRAGLTGSSGGAMQAAMLMLADDRIAAAAPAVFLSDFLSIWDSLMAQDSEQIWQGMLDCGFDHADVLLALEGKPALLLGVEGDFFPPEGTFRTVAEVSEIGKRAGFRRLPEVFFDKGTHFYTPAMADRAAGFFRECLGGRAVEGADVSEKWTKARLDCLKSGQVRREFSSAVTVQDLNAAECRRLNKARARLSPETAAARRESFLRKSVFCGRSLDFPLFARTFASGRAGFADYEAVLYRNEPTRYGYGVLLRPAAAAGQKGVIVAAVREGTDRLQEISDDVMRMLGEGYAVFVPDLAGEGKFTPALGSGDRYAPYGDRYFYASMLDWCGDGIAAVRAFDLLRALRLAKEAFGASRVGLYARGNCHVYAAVAAALTDELACYEISSSFVGYEDLAGKRLYDDFDAASLDYHGLLKVCDVPELDRLAREKVKSK